MVGSSKNAQYKRSRKIYKKIVIVGQMRGKWLQTKKNKQLKSLEKKFKKLRSSRLQLFN